MIQRDINIRNLDFKGTFGQIFHDIFDTMTENGGQNNEKVREVHNWLRGIDQCHLERVLGAAPDTSKWQQHLPGSDLVQVRTRPSDFVGLSSLLNCNYKQSFTCLHLYLSITYNLYPSTSTKYVKRQTCLLMTWMKA